LRRKRDSSRGDPAYRDLARQRIVLLYRMAVEAARRGDVGYARDLGGLAWEMYRSTRARIPRWLKRGLCRRCHAPLIPGVTARVRLRSQGRRFSYVTVTCLACGWTRRYPYKTGDRPAPGGAAENAGKPEEEG